MCIRDSIYPISGNIESQWNLWKFLKCYIFCRNYHFSFCPAEFAGFQTFFIVLLDKQSFSYYDTHNQPRKTVEKEEYIFDRVFTESCRRWDCSIALEMEWTFEGSPEFQYGLTATAVVKRAAYMLVYEKSGPKGQIEWHRGYEIRLKDQI